MTKDIVRLKPSDGADRPRPWATSVSYSAATDEISLVLNRGVTLVVPRSHVEELRDVPKSSLTHLTLIGEGEALAAEAEDVHIFVPGLVRDLVGDFMLKCVAEERPAAARRRAAKAL